MATPQLIERQRMPWWWFAIAMIIWATFVIAVLIVVPPQGAAAVAVVTGALVVFGLLLWGRTAITVGHEGVRVGRSLLQWQYLGEIRALDSEQAKRRLGPQAQVTAWLAIRPWTPEAVEITVEDPADPHPYWLVGCRDSVAVVETINAARPSSPDTQVVGSTDRPQGD